MTPCVVRQQKMIIGSLSYAKTDITSQSVDSVKV